MTTSQDISTSQKIRLLDQFYAAFIFLCLLLLGVGVPFIFYRKASSATIAVIAIGCVIGARSMSRHGRPERSLAIFSMGMWVLLVALIFGGLPPNGAAVALAISVMLSVVVSARAGVLFGATYMCAWLSYIVLGMYHLAPAPFFASIPLTGWLIVAGATWLILIPIPALVNNLRHSVSVQRAVIEATTDALLVVNHSGEVQTYNQKFIGMWGIPPELIATGNNSAMLEFVVSQVEAPEAFMRRVHALYANPEQSSCDVLTFKDGRSVERHSHPQMMGDAIVGRVWSFRDVTVARKAQDELRSSQEKLQALFDLSPLGMARNGMEGTFFEVNSAFVRMLGYTLEELNAMSYWDITPHSYASLEAEQLHSLHTRGSYGPYEKEYIHKDGHRFPVRLNGIQILGSDGQSSIWSIIEDITQQKSNELSLTEAKLKAEEASQAKSQFLANMSHEIRTPMNAVLGMLQLLQSSELNARQMDYASKSESAARSLLGLLNDILDFSKMNAEKMDLDPHMFRVDRLMRDLAVVLSANVADKSIEVLYDIDPHLPEVMLGDAMRLKQVLINLGGNAAKFTQKGEVVLSLRLARALAQTPDTALLEFSVKDTGIGISQENLEKIFTGFSQAETATTRKFGGTGLGLAISKRLVELMGGELQVRSVLGLGSTFSFTLELPVVRNPPPEFQAEKLSPKDVRNVLIIDDNPVACELVMQITRSWEWPTDVAHDGMVALGMIRSQCQGGTPAYQVIFVDLHMPGMDGWETTSRIRALCTSFNMAQPQIIMVTANGREVLSHRTLEEQKMLSGFLVKPVTASMLLDAVMDVPSRDVQIRLRQRASKRQLAGMRILVVEDNMINQQVAEELLNSEGALVSLAADGQQGVAAVASAVPPYDAVLMDIQMPIMDGYEATREIRGTLGMATMPIIGLTANAMASDREACLHSGMNEHLGKPFDLRRLVSMLIRLTGRKPGSEAALPAPQDQGTTEHLNPAPIDLQLVTDDIDLPLALGRMSGMQSLYLRSARDLHHALSTLAPSLQELLRVGDFKQLAMQVHTFKGTTATLGLKRLSLAMEQLERMCGTGHEPDALQAKIVASSGLIASAQSALVQAMALLEALETNPTRPPAHERSGGSTQAVAYAKEILASWTPLFEASDFAVLEKFAENRQTLQALPEEALARLESAMQDLDLEKAQQVCRELLAPDFSRVTSPGL